MAEIKKLNEVKPGDTLYCIAYDIGGDTEISIVEITVKDVITDGPRTDIGIYSKEAIIINEKVPNSTEPAGKFVIDQYCYGDECATHKHGIYTNFFEAFKAALEEAERRSNEVNKEIDRLFARQKSIFTSISTLSWEADKRIKNKQ